MTAGILRRLRVQGVSSRAFGTLVNWGRNSWRDNSYDFQSQGLASRAKLGREVGAEKAAGACKQLQCMPGLILWGCCFISGPSPWGCCVEPTPPCLAPPRCDLEPLAQDSLCLETRWWTHSWGSKFWREGPALWCDIHGFTSHLLFLSRSASFSGLLCLGIFYRLQFQNCSKALARLCSSEFPPSSRTWYIGSQTFMSTRIYLQPRL